MKRKLWPLLFIFLFSSCMMIPWGTSEWIGRKVDSVAIGQNKQQVADALGEKAEFLLSCDPADSVRYEVVAFELGHYWYHEELYFLFKNDRLISTPQGTYLLLSELQRLDCLKASALFTKNAETPQA